MRHLPNTTSNNHDKLHTAVAKGICSEGERWHMGAQLVTILRNLLEARERAHKGYAKGMAALRRGGTVRTMWVAKNEACGLRRGSKVTRRSDMMDLAGSGVRFREVHYPSNPDLKKALKEMAQVISGLHHQVQYGFVPKRDCVASAHQHRFARVVLLLDIQDAFDQVTEAQVVMILRKVFRINRLEAEWIAELCCYNGHLYQGNPMAPVLFNLRALWLAERLLRLCQANGLALTMYADDICISSNSWEYVSRRFIRTVRRICSECGLEVNADKVKVHRVSPYKTGSFDITGLVIDWDEEERPYVRPIHRKRTYKLADYLEYLRMRGIEQSRELNKLGQPKSLAMVENGLRLWAERKSEPFEDEQLAITL